MVARNDLPVRVDSPKKLQTWKIPTQRLDLGEGYKPSIARLPDGELIMVSLQQEGSTQDGTFTERMPVRRSRDNGDTWSEPQIAADVIGREQWLTCTADGTLFITCHLLTQDTSNEDGNVHSYLHRSTDRGHTWERTKVLLEGELRCCVPRESGTHTSRNVVELDDGTLLLGVSMVASDVAYLWRSSDGGKIWDRSTRVEIGAYHGKPYDNFDGFFCEDFTYLSAGGRLFHWIRCGPPSPMYPMEDGRPIPAGNDNIDRSLICHSDDGGLTWSDIRDFGDYGMHYARPLRLRDGLLLLTYTQRSTFYPLGLRAIISDDDGHTWDFFHDRIVIEGSTPWGGTSGGGFGNTLQLDDGSLVSCYSYTGAEGATRIETARWELP